jgi:hypothetical protein
MQLLGTNLPRAAIMLWLKCFAGFSVFIGWATLVGWLIGVRSVGALILALILLAAGFGTIAAVIFWQDRQITEESDKFWKEHNLK